MPLHPLLKKGLHKLGFSKPTDIQRQAIPLAVDGVMTLKKQEKEAGETDEETGDAERKNRDIVGVAETVSILKSSLLPAALA